MPLLKRLASSNAVCRNLQLSQRHAATQVLSRCTCACSRVLLGMHVPSFCGLVLLLVNLYLVCCSAAEQASRVSAQSAGIV